MGYCINCPNKKATHIYSKEYLCVDCVRYWVYTYIHEDPENCKCERVDCPGFTYYDDSYCDLCGESFNNIGESLIVEYKDLEICRSCYENDFIRLDNC